MKPHESRPGARGDLVSQHRNSEGELITVERVRAGEFAGKLILCIYDDETPTIAPTLLDEGTARWLFEQVLDNFGAVKPQPVEG